jgi:HEPN domain-containing protein
LGAGDRLSQARAYLHESEESLAVARLARDHGHWSVAVKEAFDAMEQAASALIAESGRAVPRRHSVKVQLFGEVCRPGDQLMRALAFWAKRRDRSRYVDERDGRFAAPSESFGDGDASDAVADAERIVAYARERARGWSGEDDPGTAIGQGHEP